MRTAGLLLVCLAAGLGAPAQEAYDELDTVLVIGEQTPPLWKLTKNGHVLWILGTTRMQPRDMRLNSQRLQQLIAGSSEVILPGAAMVASRSVSLLPAIMESDRNPEGATLRDLMAPDAHASWLLLRQRHSNGGSHAQSGPAFAWDRQSRWVALRQRYQGGDGIERLRPTFAWEGLRRAEMDRHGLAQYNIEAGVSAIARQHDVPVRKLRAEREFMFLFSLPDPVLEQIDPKKADAAAAAVAMLAGASYGDVECLIGNLERLDPAMEALKVQASAWMRGDMGAFLAAGDGVRLQECMTDLVAAVSGGQLPGSSDGRKAQDRYYHAVRESSRKVQRRWLREVQAAVRKNEVTFSVLPIEGLLADDGYLAKLRARGFVLEEPG